MKNSKEQVPMMDNSVETSDLPVMLEEKPMQTLESSVDELEEELVAIEKSFFEKNVKGIIYTLYFVCTMLFLADFKIHHHHAHFPWEHWFGFFSIYGFVCCVLLVLLAKHVVRPVMQREENYYD